MRGAKVDYLVFDYLAEIIMSILARARMKDAQAGYATDFPAIVMKSVLREVVAQGIRVVSNAGGLNPSACAAAVAAQEEPKPGRYRLSFTIDTDADPSDLLDRLTEYAEGLEEDLEPATDWTGSVEIPATVPRHSITVEVTA